MPASRRRAWPAAPRRDGSAASRVTASPSIARSPRIAPVIRTTLLYGRVASRTAFAVAASSVPNAIAVGPLRSGDSASPTVSAAAIRMRRFFTTRYRTSCLCRARLISAISLTVRPRYSETIMVRAFASSSRSAATVACFASVGIQPPLSLRHADRRAAVGRPEQDPGSPLRRIPWQPPEGGRPRLAGAHPPAKVEAPTASACSSSSPIGALTGDRPVRSDGSSPARRPRMVAHYGRRLSAAVRLCRLFDVSRSSRKAAAERVRERT